MSTGAGANAVPDECPLPGAVLDRLAAGAEYADRSPDWPRASWDAIRSAGVPAWPVPEEYGGDGRSHAETLRGGEAIASACLTTSFILTQQEAAARLLLKGPPHLKDRFLPGVAAGESFLTVGLSHLTTSRQDRGPALRATPAAGGGFVLYGEVPWVTGADRADAVVTGATLPDASQVVLILPSGRAGVTVLPPLVLASFAGSRTSSVRYDAVAVAPELVLLGPGERVLGKAAGGGLETSGPAIGLAAAATTYLRGEAAHRPAFAGHAARFETALSNARQRLDTLAAAAEPDPAAILALRTDCSRLALRTTQAALLAAKGAGFAAPHPAQRWARQALFFLVWSCPPRVVDGLLGELLPDAV